MTITHRNRPVARLIAIDENDPVMRLHQLASTGKVRIPEGFGKPWDIDPVRPSKGEFVAALDALLEEREADR